MSKPAKIAAGGVAKPHTLATLKHIQDLKTKHGIDCDTHAGYRFVEKSVANRPS